MALPSGPILIIGAGPAGLAAAWRLESAGFRDWMLFEREAHVGGLATSIRDERGFTWDLGGHVVFSHFDLFTSLLDDLIAADGWLHHERESWIRVLGTWVPYPFQNNIHRLPPEARAECAAGLVQAALGRRDEPFRDFDDFIGRTFGPGIARHFMRPYNTKVWGFDPRKLSAGWIAERVAVPDVARVVRNLALGRDDCAWGPNNRFRFPARGGTGAIWRALAARLPAERLHLGCALGALDLEARRCTFSNGERVRFGALLSTMPLDQLAALTGREELRGPAARLVHSSAHIVGVGLRGAPPPELAPKCWMYFPGDECPFYRVTHFSLYSPANVPDITSQWSLMCEVAESAEKPVDGGSVVAEVARGLAAAGLIADSEQIIHTWHRRVEYAYPTPTPGRDPALDAIQQQLTCHGVLSRGRFGSWRYEIGNMDHAFMQGVQAAERLLTGAAEPLFSGKP